jgi:hypothetical protein
VVHAPAPAPTPARAFHNNNRLAPRAARINNVFVEQAEQSSDVVLGTLPVNSILASVLFDTGASHSFIAQNFCQKLCLLLENLPTLLSVITPGKNMRATKISHGVQIYIGSQMFLASLIELNSSGIDVILGMDWLKANNAIIDCGNHSVTLPTPYGHIVYSPKETPSIQLYALEAQPLPELENVPVVCDFPDVFPKELPGMPPDRAVEFVIELEPGTAPISKRPYKMGPLELAELKKQLDEQERLGFI